MDKLKRSNENILLSEINSFTKATNDKYDQQLWILKNAQDDSKKTDRLKVKECKWCFYLKPEAFAFSAFTKWLCVGCGLPQTSDSSAVDRFCGGFSDKYKACIKCGSDLDMNASRSKLSYE
jgi:hypothetical protein